jgi:hypothetical protein
MSLCQVGLYNKQEMNLIGELLSSSTTAVSIVLQLPTFQRRTKATTYYYYKTNTQLLSWTGQLIPSLLLSNGNIQNIQIQQTSKSMEKERKEMESF